MGWKRLVCIINIYRFIQYKHNPPVHPQPQKSWGGAAFEEQRQPLPFRNAVIRLLARGLQTHPMVPTDTQSATHGWALDGAWGWIQLGSGRWDGAATAAGQPPSPAHPSAPQARRGLCFATPRPQPGHHPGVQIQPPARGKGLGCTSRIQPWHRARCPRNRPVFPMARWEDEAGGKPLAFCLRERN